MDRIELHLIRSDVLLWTLGGFAEGPGEDFFIAAMRRHLTPTGKVAYGAAKELGAAYGLTANNAHKRIHDARKKGRLMKIDKGIPIPKPGGRPWKYDWSPKMAALEIGDSFFEAAATPETAVLIRAGMVARAKTLGFTVTTRILTENKTLGARCWRLA